MAWPSASGSWKDITAASGSNPSPDKDHPSASRSRSEGTEANSARILVIEDNSADVLLIRRAIKAALPGVHIEVVTDGQLAIALFDRLDGDDSLPCPTLLILDINLPKKPGSAVLEHMRKSRRCKDATVLVVSTSNADKDRNVMSNLGADGYFRKPSEVAEFMKLGDIVKNLIERPN